MFKCRQLPSTGAKLSPVIAVAFAAAKTEILLFIQTELDFAPSVDFAADWEIAAKK